MQVTVRMKLPPSGANTPPKAQKAAAGCTAHGLPNFDHLGVLIVSEDSQPSLLLQAYRRLQPRFGLLESTGKATVAALFPSRPAPTTAGASGEPNLIRNCRLVGMTMADDQKREAWRNLPETTATGLSLLAWAHPGESKISCLAAEACFAVTAHGGRMAACGGRLWPDWQPSYRSFAAASQNFDEDLPRWKGDVAHGER